jgi:hypothetical protein
MTDVGTAAAQMIRNGMSFFEIGAPGVDELLNECVTFEDLLALRARLEDFHNTVRLVISEVDGEIIGSIPDDERYTPQPLPDGGTLHVTGGKNRKDFDQPAVIGAFAESIARQLEQNYDVRGIVSAAGEIIGVDDVLPKMALDAARMMAEATGAGTPSFHQWRVGAAKALGIKLDRYCEVTTSPLSIVVRGRSKDSRLPDDTTTIDTEEE